MSKKSTKNILIAFLLNLSFAIYEFIGGSITGSIAIVSDAIHDLGDALSIGVSYFLERKSQRHPDQNYTYGYTRYSLIGGLITTIILLVGSTIVIISAMKRLFAPTPINYNGMIILALVGVVVNACAAYVTHRGESLNQKAVNLHMLEDVLGWVVVLIGAIVMRVTNFNLIDPILSIAVAIFILISAWRNCQSIFDVFLEKTPNGINLAELQQGILALPNVQNIHHMHIWSIDGFHHYATLHLVYHQHPSATKEAVRQYFKQQGIEHVTIELESSNEVCHELECLEQAAEPGHAHHHHGHVH